MSEAGCPAVADPGATLVALAQARGIRVVPLVGPSSLLLALMASGLDGQRFAFHGYLPAKSEERARAIRELEKESRARRQTQIFIETPYRNAALYAALLQHAHPETRLCLAADLTLTSEFIQTKRIREWRKTTPPELERRPTVFLMLG
jgi:16S rRNA (cytidine1402-2'-O)-methyltransferase